MPIGEVVEAVAVEIPGGERGAEVGVGLGADSEAVRGLTPELGADGTELSGLRERRRDGQSEEEGGDR